MVRYTTTIRLTRTQWLKASIRLANHGALGRLPGSNVTLPPSRNRRATACQVARLTGGTVTDTKPRNGIAGNAADSARDFSARRHSYNASTDNPSRPA